MVAANPLLHDPIPPADHVSHLARRLRARWEGDQGAPSRLARFNRECCWGLLAPGDVELTLADPTASCGTLDEAEQARFAPIFARRGAPMSFPVDVTVRHRVIPNWRRPETGKLVVLAPWPYAHLPRDWRDGALDVADEVWAPSRFVRDVYVCSGVPAEKVRLVSPGVDVERFSPDGPVYPLPTQKSRCFLFVGSPLARRGADLLLGAYLRAFTRDDDVCLIAKDGGPPDFGEGPSLVEEFRRAAADPRLPEVLVLEETLPDGELAALYRACSCVVLPYRGVTFGMPVLEGMACGVPAIVTAGGATDDFVDEESAWRLPFRRGSAPEWIVGPYECVGEPWQLEPDREALVETLRHVYERPDEARERGQAGRERVLEGWTWERTVAQVRYRLQEVVAPKEDPPFHAARPWHDPVAGVVSHAVGMPELDLSGEAAICQDGQNSSLAGFGSHSSLLAHRAAPIEISLCMIVRDEDPRLPKCLASISPYVDEIVVVDTGSRDTTREVARDYGARVFDFPWVDSFSVARNQSIEQARGSWILRMDADDVIAPEDGAKLRELIHRYPDRDDIAYLMEYRVPPSPDGSGGHVVDQVQLWPNRADLRFQYRLHEQLLPSVLGAGLTTVTSGISIHHCNFDWSWEGQAKRRRRDFPMLEKDLQDHPDDPFVLFNLGMTYHNTLLEYEVASHYLRRSLNASAGRNGIDRLSWRYLVRCRIAQDDWEAALDVSEEGRSRYPNEPELLLQAAEILEVLGRQEEARAVLDALVLGYDEPHFRCSDIGLRTYRGRTERALLLRRLGHLEHCEYILRELAETYPFYQPAKQELAETLRLLHRAHEADALLTQWAENGRSSTSTATRVPLPPEHLRVRPGMPSLHRSTPETRVAHFVPFMNIGGTERVILDLCRFGKERQKVVSPVDGAMRAVFEEHGIPVQVGVTHEQLVVCLADADVVNLHCLEYMPELFGAVLDAGRPMVSTLHWASELPQIPGLVICVAQHVYDHQEANHDRLLLIPNGIDTTRFKPAKRRGKRTQIIRVCRPDKCADYFWPAVYQVLDACPEVDVTLVGGPVYEGGRIRALGYRHDVDQLLAKADLFAYAPKPWEGAMDLVVLEAMASGLPCVLSDVACVREAIEHEVTGLLTPYEDVPAFTESLSRLVRDRDLRRTMGERAAKIARERFDVRDRMPLYSAAYRRALDEALLPSQQAEWRERAQGELAIA
jgi:glycosyltransferase involved in cell wall biosynthesis